MVKKPKTRPKAVAGSRPAPRRAMRTATAKAGPRKLSAETPRPPRLTKSPLGRSELKDFRQMLLAKRRALVGDMNNMEAEAFRGNRQDRSGDLSTIPIHPADIGTDNFEQEFTLGLLESERTLLREIDEALERIASGTYGICLGTGQPIDKARLRARPWSKYCIEYARRIEKGLARPEDDAALGEEEREEHEPEAEAEPEAEPEADVEPEPDREPEAEPAEDEAFDEDTE